MTVYSLNQIQDIKENIEDFCLDEEVNLTLQNLCKLLGLNNQNIKSKPIRKERLSMNEQNMWKKNEPFKTTVFEKKEGTECLLNKLRGVLNKISNKNYLEQEEKVQEIINNIIEFKDDEKETIDEKFNKIFEVFYRVLINNKVYINLYVQLFNFLCEEYYQFEDYMEVLIEKYKKSIQEFEYVDSDEDYDKYCAINKINEERKSLYGFLICISGNEICSFSDILDINNTLFSYLEDNIESQEHLHINEEIVENISVFVKEGKQKILKDVSKFSIEENLKYYSELKYKKNTGFSTRMKFKFMDLVEFFKK
tara:strand:- start:6852 stop:7778 length:927 start_codon:yes stop_codon:yes gene_type:complete